MNESRTYNPLQYGPLLIKTIIGINIFMYLVSLLFSGSAVHLTKNPLFFLSPSIQALKFLGAAGIDQIGWIAIWKSLITANWLHGSVLHLLFNMMALRTVAPLVVKEFGKARMFCIYVLSGMAGFYLSYIGRVPLTIGASCSLCGLIGAALYFGKSRGGIWGQLVYKQTSGWVISLIVIGFLLPNINNWGHGGGLLSGIILGWVFGYKERRQTSIIDKILAFLLVGLTLYLLAGVTLAGLIWLFA
jgi:rhomboid protease GluP